MCKLHNSLLCVQSPLSFRLWAVESYNNKSSAFAPHHLHASCVCYCHAAHVYEIHLKDGLTN